MPNETSGERLLARRYRLVAHVGRGGMGTVWQAHDEVLGRDVAVKEVILPHGLTDEERAVQYKRTFREARTAARLGHPNVVTVYDVVEEDGRPWIIMELIPARSLDQVIKQEGPLDVRRTAEIGRQMLAALHAAHEAGVLHRDVKPSNVLVTDGPAGDRAVLTDFGIATASGDATLTQTGLVMGSPAYIAPERARGRTAGPASDLWSLGVTLYSMLHGRSPFERSEPMAALVAVISEDPDPPERAGRLAPVIEGLLRKNPDERMDAIEAGILLDEIVRQETVDTQRTLVVEVPPAERTDPPKPAEPPATGDPTDGSTRVTPVVADPGSAASWQTGQPTEPAPAAATGSPPARREGGGAIAGLSRNALVIGGIVLVLLVVIVSVVLASTKDNKPADKRGGAAPAKTSKTTKSSKSPSPSPSSAKPSETPKTSSPAAADVPPGWHVYKDSTGYSIAVPDGWSGPKHRSYSPSSVFFEPPDGPGYIQIDQAASANTSALKDWKDFEPTRRGSFPNYHRIKIAPVDQGEPVHDSTGEKAADWEWTYDSKGERLHALNRGFVMNGHGYAIVLVAPDKSWGKTLSDLAPLYQHFKAAP
ncbi:serine/threonine-protein kinase [Actinomadura macrotermitis]|nr:serine/threonine-protein kinase [Actinomadura macrotermitis]